MSQPTPTTTSPTSPSSPTSPINPPSPLPQPHPFRPLFLTLLLACPALALLPPRKLDLYTFTLSGAFVYSATELAYTHPRRLRAQQDQARLLRMGDRGAEGGDEQSLGILAEKEKEEIGERDGDEDGRKMGDMQEEEEGGVKGLLRSIWMGSEKAGWQKRRLEREREELESGRGYGDLIMEQVREVFPGFGGGGGGRGGDGDGDGDELKGGKRG